MSEFEKLSEKLVLRMNNDIREKGGSGLGFAEDRIIRRIPVEEKGIWGSGFIRDIDLIMQCPFYNRYADKTQVFSFLRNDDISRRGLHVQLVSRIARTIGSALGLNTDLIEAISLGHDIGHTPFGHAGEKILDGLYTRYAGKHFSHNIQSVRVLDRIFPFNLSLQTLSGISSHNGEYELSEYNPSVLTDFAEYDSQIAGCYEDGENTLKLVPNTLEGCVVRIADIIAYLGKDRQDAERAQLIDSRMFSVDGIGDDNSRIINDLIVNIIECSYGKPYICMDKEHFRRLSVAKEENYRLIYGNENVRQRIDSVVAPMMERMYLRIIDDLKSGNTCAPVFTHHIDYINQNFRDRKTPYEDEAPDDIAVDYIASMTDDYFVDYYNWLYPESPSGIEYIGYFDI